jgi:cystathionine beta-lyase
MANFDEIIDRRGSCSLKHDFAGERGMPEGLVSMWVADMDFHSPDCISEALKRAAGFGIYGYTSPKEDYYAALTRWFSERHGFKFSREHVITTPGVVFALAACVRAFTEEGEGVMLQRPVYYPFTEVILSNRRRLVNNPLSRLPDGRYGVDFQDFENKIVSEGVKLFLLCSPHNPVGRVWKAEELRRMGEICLKHGVVVVSDEIHCDFVFPGSRHQVFQMLSGDFADICVSCTSPGKTFNLAGLQISNIIIENQALRRRFRSAVEETGYSQPPLMGVVACRAAYEGGGQWYEEMMAYLLGNLDYMRSFINERLPALKLIEPEGTYLTWVDFSGVCTPEQSRELIVNRAGLWLDDGTMFGPEGEGFQRINIACPRAVLKNALESLESAINDY